jgi:glycine cleavage system H protein
MSTRLYTKDHTWVLAEGNRARVGISDFAQRELGDIAYVELPSAGARIVRGEVACTVDSLKSSSEIYSPLSGSVAEVNTGLSSEEKCRLVNTDPLGEGWLFGLDMSDPGELEFLLSEKDYEAYIKGT